MTTLELSQEGSDCSLNIRECEEEAGSQERAGQGINYKDKL